MKLSEWHSQTNQNLVDLAERMFRLQSVSLDLLNRPVKGHWSALGCIDHLVKAGEGYLPRIEAAIQSAPDSQGDLELKFGFVARRMMHMVSPAGPNFIPVPPSAMPATGDLTVATLAEFQGQLSVMRELAGRARAKDVRMVTLVSPISPLLKLTVPEALSILTFHAQRHVGQAERAIR